MWLIDEKINIFHHVCYWIDAHLEWLIELEPESKNMKLRIYFLLLFGKQTPQAKSLACLDKGVSIPLVG